ncbi:NADH-quinone oxidoreductase subunit M [Oscillatoria sp. FACHB-1406]|uniref:NADH-quinone oxidoreductase subunit M n=1 Tax=Oscillatoria sp. FACHB-1406 TaxID=2692846 RepID=UPI0016822A31|nr:NADH-quinone oxidoreductase subunit M [Oscillatoria sp. FACHB-1406]MBD2578004.1 NADH-quinone oxidoreductase subunit M [Oscillatoria sp. FACHB-1406]
MLSTLLWLPLIGALTIALLPEKFDTQQLRRVTASFVAIILVITVYLLLQFNLQDSGMQFSEYHRWIEPIGLNYSVGVDGLSLPLIGLNVLLTGLAIYTKDEQEVKRPKMYYALVLLVNAGVTGALIAQNLLLFVIFYEVELIPFYLLISIWGGEKRGYAAMKFLLYTAVSGLLILAAFLGIGFLNPAQSFEYSAISTLDLSWTAQLVLLGLLLVGFGIKIPLVPLHTWMPDAYVESSPGTAILLGGILAKLGTYGLVRYGLGLFPETWEVVAPILATIGTVSVLYGALAAIAQRDLKRMVAYSSIGHMGYILVATAAGTKLSILGAVSQMISHGLILALLFYLVGIVERKAGTRDLDILNGLMNPIRGLPLTSALLIAAGMASAGIPGLVGFPAEFMVFQGSFASFPIPTLICIISSGLTAVYFVILLNRTCFGKLDNLRAYYPRTIAVERIPALVLTAIVLFLGVQPAWLVRWIQPYSNAIAADLNAFSQPALVQSAVKKIPPKGEQPILKVPQNGLLKLPKPNLK